MHHRLDRAAHHHALMSVWSNVKGRREPVNSQSRGASFAVAPRIARLAQ